MLFEVVVERTVGSQDQRKHVVVQHFLQERHDLGSSWTSLEKKH